MPLLKYTLLVGCSLLALLFAAERILSPAPATGQSASTSLVVLKKMANHGETRGFAPLADAGVFLPVPIAEVPVPMIADESVSPTSPAQIADVAPLAMNAQARALDSDVVKKPSRRIRKKVAERKIPQVRDLYVQNVQRAPDGFFGAIQSW